MKRLLAMMVAVVFGVAACGGDSADSTVDDGSQPTPSAATADDGGSSGATSEGAGPSTATVTIGDETHEFSTEGTPIAQCKPDLFGVFSVQLTMVGGDGSVQIVALHDDTDPAVVDQVNVVRVSVGDEDWFADEDSDMFDMSDTLEPGMTQVDSVEVDGSTVRGTATFVRSSSLFAGEVETTTGTFEATCGEERIS